LTRSSRPTVSVLGLSVTPIKHYNGQARS